MLLDGEPVRLWETADVDAGEVRVTCTNHLGMVPSKPEDVRSETWRGRVTVRRRA